MDSESNNSTTVNHFIIKSLEKSFKIIEQT